MRCNPRQQEASYVEMNSDIKFTDIDLLFKLQIDKIRERLNPPTHSTGPKKPSLEETESRLLDDLTEDDNVDQSR